jgi:hypothetical protein
MTTWFAFGKRLAPLVPLAVAFAAAALPLPAAAAHRPTFVVDAVHVTVAGGFSGFVLSSAPGDATQETSMVDRARQRTLSVIAVPFGTRPATEDALPLARHGGAGAYRRILHDYRVRSGDFAIDAPTVTLFGNRVEGDLSQRHDRLMDSSGHAIEHDVFTGEWVTEAGQRLWIVRATQNAPSDHPLGDVADFIGELQGINVWSDSSVGAPTTVFADVVRDAAPTSTPDAQPTTALRAPQAYSDPCDAADYDRATQRTDWRHRLGASFQGVPACGPRLATGGMGVAAGFSAGLPSGVLQFDATELSLRWMFLTYNTPPFLGNGDELLGNYDPTGGGQALYKYVNARRSGRYPHAGDVLSYETGGTGGHTAVVVDVHADSRGTGYVDVMEQDGSSGGLARLEMIDDQVFSCLGGALSGWLSPRPYR